MTFFIVFLDALGFSLIIPIIPYIIDYFQGSEIDAGLIYSGYSCCQLISNYLVFFVKCRFDDIWSTK